MTLMETLADYGQNAANALRALFFSAGSFLSPFPLIVAALIAALVVARRMRRAGERADAGAIFRALFPAEIWRHPSARHDIFIILINDGLLFFLPAMSGIAVAELSSVAASSVGADAALARAGSGNVASMAFFGVYIALAWDFSATFGHYLKHKIPLLWEFHKVHHCAEVLTPFTAMRRHPAEMIVGSFVTAAGVSLATILWAAAFGAPGATMQIGGVALIIYLWRLIGYNIRHSHVWISYGPFWNRFLMSPAHHQLHHSRDPRHYDRNFGHIFTFWDRLFGTLYQPVDGEEFEFGIEREENAELNTLAALYLKPMQKAAARFAPGKTPVPAQPAE